MFHAGTNATAKSGIYVTGIGKWGFYVSQDV